MPMCLVSLLADVRELDARSGVALDSARVGAEVLPSSSFSATVNVDMRAAMRARRLEDSSSSARSTAVFLVSASKPRNDVRSKAFCLNRSAPTCIEGGREVERRMLV